MKGPSDTIHVKESARLNLLSSYVKSGADGQLLVADQSIKHSSHAREQEQLIRFHTAISTDLRKETATYVVISWNQNLS
jgi:hypothetical protein